MTEDTRKPNADSLHQATLSDKCDDQSTVDFIAALRTIRREKVKILGIAVFFLVFSTFLAFILPNEYTSSVAFIPPSSNGGSSVASAVAGQFTMPGMGDLLGARSSGDLYAGILKSRSIATSLIKRFDLLSVFNVKKESVAVKKLQSSTSVTVDPKSTIVTLEVTAKTPQLAQNLANAYMDTLRETNGRLALTQSSQRRLFFERQLANEKDKLADAEIDLKKTEEESGFIAPTGQTEAEIRTIADTQAQIDVREVQLAALRQSATEQNPEVIRLRSEVENLQNQLGRLQRGASSRDESSIPTSKVPEAQLEYVRKEREVKYHEALFEMLSRDYEAARLDESREAPLLQVLDPASYPDTRSSPKRLLIIAGGCILGLLTGCMWVLFRQRMETSSHFDR